MKMVLAIVLPVSALTIYELHGMSSEIGVLIRSRAMDSQHASSNWREVEGVYTSITTYREAGESEDDFVLRHLAAMRSMKDQLKSEPDSGRIERR